MLLDLEKSRFGVGLLWCDYVWSIPKGVDLLRRIRPGIRGFDEDTGNLVHQQYN